MAKIWSQETESYIPMLYRSEGNLGMKFIDTPCIWLRHIYVINLCYLLSQTFAAPSIEITSYIWFSGEETAFGANASFIM